MKYTFVILNQLNIKKIKSIKIILEKIIKKQKEKKLCRETPWQFIVFHEKIYSCNFQQLNIKNNKIDKNNFEKNYNKKIIWGNTLAVNVVLKKITTKLN